MEYEILLIREKQFADSLIACLTTLPCLVKENVKSHTIFFFLSFLDCIDGCFILGSFVLGPYCEKLQLSIWLSQGQGFCLYFSNQCSGDMGSLWIFVCVHNWYWNFCYYIYFDHVFWWIILSGRIFCFY